MMVLDENEMQSPIVCLCVLFVRSVDSLEILHVLHCIAERMNE